MTTSPAATPVQPRARCQRGRRRTVRSAGVHSPSLPNDSTTRCPRGSDAGCRTPMWPCRRPGDDDPGPLGRSGSLGLLRPLDFPSGAMLPTLRHAVVVSGSTHSAVTARETPLSTAMGSPTTGRLLAGDPSSEGFAQPGRAPPMRLELVDLVADVIATSNSVPLRQRVVVASGRATKEKAERSGHREEDPDGQPACVVAVPSLSDEGLQPRPVCWSIPGTAASTTRWERTASQPPVHAAGTPGATPSALAPSLWLDGRGGRAGGHRAQRPDALLPYGHAPTVRPR